MQVFKSALQTLPDSPREKIKKIIILLETPFNKRDYDRFGVDIFHDNGFDVEVWEITPITRPKAHQLVKVPDPVSYEKYRPFFFKKEVVKAVNNSGEGCLIISYVTYRMATFFLFKAISRAGIPYCNSVGGSLPINIPDKLLSWSDIQRKLKNFTKKNIARKIDLFVSKINHLRLRTQGPAFTLVHGGEMTYAKTKNIKSKNTEIINLHSFDYDKYLYIKNGQATFEENSYAVFLDEYIPFHPDYNVIGLEPYDYAEDYYPALCGYFDRFETQHNLEIVIAAHPRSAYEKHPDYFHGRRIFRGKTAELVKKSKVVLVHSSTSVNFAVLFMKPIIFLTTDGLNSSLQKDFIESMSAHFNKNIVNVSLPYTPVKNQIMPIDTDLYDNYIDKYIKTKESPCELSWQIFSYRIKTMELLRQESIADL